MNICFSIDDGFTKHCAAAIASILKNSDKEDVLNFYILVGGISENNKLRLQSLNKIRNFQLDFISINNNEFQNCPIPDTCSHITIPANYRFKMASLFPNLDKILYLDSDLLVNSNIKELWDTNIDEYYIAAVEDILSESNSRRLLINKENNECYCNSGVILANLKKWREDNVEAKLFKEIENFEFEILWPDQDVINHVFRGKIKTLALKWNLQILPDISMAQYKDETLKEYLNTTKSPNIIHFVGPEKPWKYGAEIKYRDLYFKYLNLTPFKFKSPIDYLSFAINDSLAKLYKIPFLKKINDKKTIKNKLKADSFQKRIDELSAQYENKKILIYGTGLLFDVIVENYTLSRLNIIGVADKKFETTKKQNYKKFKSVAPADIVDLRPDVIIITTTKTTMIKDYITTIYNEKNMYLPVFQSLY